MKKLTAPIAEIFVSYQGEGLYCGQKQVFLRFAGCNLGCAYCDESAAGDGAAARELSPVSAAGEILRLARKNRAGAVSFTGGEPLLNWKFIRELAPGLRKAGLTLHLETNGTLYRELKKIKKDIDVIAMDIKAPSSTRGRKMWREHAAFLSEAPEKTFVKVVLTSGTSLADLKKAVNLAAKIRPALPFFLQPATPRHRSIRPPGIVFMEKACCYAASRLARVRVLPQQHPIWGVK